MVEQVELWRVVGGGTVVLPTVNALPASSSVSKVAIVIFLPVEVFMNFILSFEFTNLRDQAIA